MRRSAGSCVTASSFSDLPATGNFRYLVRGRNAGGFGSGARTPAASRGRRAIAPRPTARATQDGRTGSSGKQTRRMRDAGDF